MRRSAKLHRGRRCRRGRVDGDLARWRSTPQARTSATRHGRAVVADADPGTRQRRHHRSSRGRRAVPSPSPSQGHRRRHRRPRVRLRQRSRTLQLVGERHQGGVPSVDARELFAPLGPSYRPRRRGALLRPGPALAALSRRAGPGDGGHVLDVATGTDSSQRSFLRRGFRVTVSTRAPRCSRAPASGSARVELVESSAETLPFDDATFDHLTVTYLLRYVDDPGATVAELARVVRPGGVVASLEFGVPSALRHPRVGAVCPRRPSARWRAAQRLARGR